jgi:2-keto-3-deoxy-L-rhamnonate aldolase RhmA
MDRVAEVVVASDKTLGILAGTRGIAADWYDRGARYFAAGFEGIIKQGIQAYLPRDR